MCRKTTNGGKTWVACGSSLPPLAAVDFANASTGWVLGNAGAFPSIAAHIFKLTGGGATWTDQSSNVSPAAPTYGLIALFCTNPTHCYAVGQSEAGLHTDDGINWVLDHIATR